MLKNEIPAENSRRNKALKAAGMDGMNGKRSMSTRKITSLAILSALAVIFMFLETALPFMPPFLKLDISEIPVLLGAFAFGPGSAIIIELIKNLIHLPFTQTAGVGELANFLAGSFFTGTAGIVYHFYKNKRGAIGAMAVGTVVMTVFSSLFNYFFMLDFYAKFYGMSMDSIVAMSAAVNVYVTDVKSLIVFAFIPFNLFKGFVVSLITAIIYKRVSPFLHGKKRMVHAGTSAVSKD